MRRYRALQILVVFLFACMCAASWSEAADLKSRIIGKWVEEGGTERVEFLQDGTVIIVQGTMSAAGDYRFIDVNRMRVDLKGVYGSKVFEVGIVVKTGALVMKEPNGKVSTYVTEAEAARRVTAAKKAAADAERKRKEAIENDPDMLQRIADAFFETKEFKEAVSAYKKLLKIRPSTDIYNNIGLSLHFIGKTAEGLKYVEDGIIQEQSNQRIWLTKGFLLAHGMSNIEGACAAWEKAIALNPESQFGMAASENFAQFNCPSQSNRK